MSDKKSEKTINMLLKDLKLLDKRQAGWLEKADKYIHHIIRDEL